MLRRGKGSTGNRIYGRGQKFWRIPLRASCAASKVPGRYEGQTSLSDSLCRRSAIGLLPIRAPKSEILEVFLLYSSTAPLRAEVHRPSPCGVSLLPGCPGTAMGSNVKTDLLMIRHSSAGLFVTAFFPIGLNNPDSDSAEIGWAFLKQKSVS